MKTLQWILDTSYSESRDTNIFGMIKIYWLVKSLIAQAIEERDFQQQSKFMRKEEFMEAKYDALVRVQQGLKAAVVEDDSEPQGKGPSEQQAEDNQQHCKPEFIILNSDSSNDQ